MMCAHEKNSSDHYKTMTRQHYQSLKIQHEEGYFDNNALIAYIPAVPITLK
jgi:hypothetical protein